MPSRQKRLAKPVVTLRPRKLTFRLGTEKTKVLANEPGAWIKGVYRFGQSFSDIVNDELTLAVTSGSVSYYSGVLSEYALEIVMETAALGKSVEALERYKTSDELITGLDAACAAYSLTWTKVLVEYESGSHYRLVVSNGGLQDCTLSGAFFDFGWACHGLRVDEGFSAVVPAGGDYEFPSICRFRESDFYGVCLTGFTFDCSGGDCDPSTIATIYPEGGNIEDFAFSVDDPVSFGATTKRALCVMLVNDFGEVVTNNGLGEEGRITLHFSQEYQEEPLLPNR